jgi:DNA-binding NtrC family response regulator
MITIENGERKPSRNLPVPVRPGEERLPEHIVAASEEMRELIGIIRAIAPTEITVLLLGESGTGKEVLARLIHDFSQRKRGPFVTVNCGAIPEGLIESELFGHEKGAFTGAHVQRKGFFEAANGGTLFLDEIGEMPLQLQVKLLRVLETGAFSRVGSTASLTTDARIIAATNRDLELEVRSARFRADLYYRLRAVMLRIPPLRNRREDIPFLIETLLRDFVKKHRLEQMPSIDNEGIHLLIDHEWRGNVRELRNVMEQLVVLSAVNRSDVTPVQITRNAIERALSDGDQFWQEPVRNLPVPSFLSSMPSEQTERELIYRALLELKSELSEIKSMIATKGTHKSQFALPAPPESNGERVRSLEVIERDALRHALETYRGNRREAARALGISERTLYRKLKEQGLAEHA